MIDEILMAIVFVCIWVVQRRIFGTLSAPGISTLFRIVAAKDHRTANFLGAVLLFLVQVFGLQISLRRHGYMPAYWAVPIVVSALAFWMAWLSRRSPNNRGKFNGRKV
jgi:hypothetical protein